MTRHLTVAALLAVAVGAALVSIAAAEVASVCEGLVNVLEGGDEGRRP